VTQDGEGVQPAGQSAVSCPVAWVSLSRGRLLLAGPYPGPVFLYSAKRSSFQEKPLMSVQGADLTAELSVVSCRVVSREVAIGSSAASPPACHGRPRWKDDAGTSPLTVDPVIRKPLRSAAVLGAAIHPAELPSHRFFSVMTDLSITAVPRPKMKSTLPTT